TGQIADYTFHPGTGFVYNRKAPAGFTWTEYPTTELLASRMNVRLNPNYNLVAHPYGPATDLNDTTLNAVASAGDFVYIYDNGYTRYDWQTGTGDPELDNKWVLAGTTEVAPIDLAAGESFYYFNAGTEIKNWTEMNPDFVRMAVGGIDPGDVNFLSNPMDWPIDIQTASFTQEAVGNIDAYLADNITFWNADTQVWESHYFVGEDPAVPEELHNKWIDPAQMAASQKQLQPGEGFYYNSKAAGSKLWVEGDGGTMPPALYVEVTNGNNYISNPLSVPLELNASTLNQVGTFDPNPASADRVIVDGELFSLSVAGGPYHQWTGNPVLDPGEGFTYYRQSGTDYWVQ
ncbi:MAG: hypothetical protein K8I00_11760, partial [Candidatus Omnitrophica bacterium]|nr:hypothetical protein [Candidatus Omnitrophota bacterium]